MLEDRTIQLHDHNRERIAPVVVDDVGQTHKLQSGADSGSTGGRIQRILGRTVHRVDIAARRGHIKVLAEVARRNGSVSLNHEERERIVHDVGGRAVGTVVQASRRRICGD